MRIPTICFNLLILAGLITTTAPLHATPVIEEWQTSEGSRVYFAEVPNLAMVDLRVVFDAGSSRNSGRHGLSDLTNSLLDQGSVDLDAQQIAESFAGVGARFGNGALRDMAWLSLRSLTEERLLEPALDAFVSLLAKPRFSTDDLERVRSRLLVGLERERESPAAIASRAFYNALYRDHPYGSPPLEEEIASVQSITREEIVDFHRRYYVAANAVIAITGAISSEKAREIAGRLASALSAGKQPPTLPAPTPLEQSVTVEIDHPSSQTHIHVGQLGVRRGDPDYFTLLVANHVLGGNGLVSRISREIREERGLAYSAYSHFSPMAVEGPFRMVVQTANSSAQEALEQLERLLEEWHEQGVSEEEYQAALNHLIGSQPLRTDSNSEINEYLAMIGFYRLPLDYLERLTEHLRGVSYESISTTLKRRIDPQRQLTIMVGGKRDKARQ